MRLAQHARAVRLAAGTRAPWAVAGVAVTLAACGQKGPLYLPDKGGAVVTSPVPSAAPPPAPAAPPQSAPNQPAQSAPEQPTQTPPATPKKTDKDNDQQTPQ